MNIENLRKTRDYIEAHPENYNQMKYFHPCGTAACIAGHAIIACGGKIIPSNSQSVPWCIIPGHEFKMSPVNAGASLLDLTTNQVGQMFMGRNVTSEDAIAMLNYCIEHDEVQWPEHDEDDDF